MPRYYFDLHNHLGFTDDDEDQFFDDSAAAREEAIRSIREIISEEALGGVIDLNGYIEIKRRDSDKVGRVNYGEAINFKQD